MTSQEVRAALRRHYGLAAVGTGTEEWTLHDEVSHASVAGTTIDMLAIRAWGGKPKGHERHAIEIKVSRSDWLRELRLGKWQVWQPYVHYFAFAAPSGLIPPAELPAGCSLLEVDDRGVRWTVRGARANPTAMPERVWVEMARRASRLAEEIRRAAYPTADLVAERAERQRFEAKAERLQAAQDDLRMRMTRMLDLVRDADVICSACGETMVYSKLPRRRSTWRWRHDGHDGTCFGSPVLRDLAAGDS